MKEILCENRENEYFTEEGLTTMTGLPQDKWKLTIVKELIDNSLDAIDELDTKNIDIECRDGIFAIYDNYGGIPEKDIDSIHNFTQYVSSKRHFQVVSRGYQGNALKTIIAICYLWDADLYFITGNRRLIYKIDESKLKIGNVEFKKTVEDAREAKSGIIIKDINFNADLVREKMLTYYQCNLDVTFTFNDDIYEAIIASAKRAAKTFIHWYDFKKFDRLLQGITNKDPERTTKAFCNKFSGVQRALSKMSFPFKRLSEFNTNEESVRDLYDELKTIAEKPNPSILKRFTIGKKTIEAMFGEGGMWKYKSEYGEYKYREANIPYCIEGFILRTENISGAPIMTAINNSMSYEKCPFKYNSEYIKFCKKDYWPSSLESLLDKSGFTEANGVLLFLHFISPFIEFTDKAKANIMADTFKDKLIKVTEYLTKDIIKEVMKVRRERNRQFNLKNVIHKLKKESKKKLMRRHFFEAYEIASSGYRVTARQIFYTLRNIINIQYGKDLIQSDYRITFSQKVCTEFIEKHPELEDRILFERRGYFYNPVLGKELPLGTIDVIDHINSIQQNRIYQETETIYSIPDELQFNHVLFIEKQGFNIILKESGLLNRLNLGIMSTQGFATRAVKRLMKHFINKGIKVYVLHDCDIAGYLISDKFKSGSDTFREELDVVRIGLTLEDVDRMNKREYVEEVTYQNSYKDSLNILTPEEEEFFVKDIRKNIYRRVELNTLTSPELISFIESRIKYEPIKPSIEELKGYIEIRKPEIVKEALYRAYGSDVKDFDIDETEIAKLINERTNGNQHWTNTLEDVINGYKNKKVNELANSLNKK